MAKITLRELRALIKEAVEEMANEGVEEISGGINVSSRRGAGYMRGMSGSAKVAPAAVAAAEEIMAKPDFAKLFAEFISLPDGDPRKAELAKMWSGALDELQEAVRRTTRKNR